MAKNNDSGTGYRGTIELASWGGYIFNNGTNDKRIRTHIADCDKLFGAPYVILETINRTFGDKIISKIYDRDYIEHLINKLNSTILKDKEEKAEFLNIWVNRLDATKPINQPIINAFSNSSVISYTECAFIPSCISKEELKAACAEVDSEWYFVDKSLRVKIAHNKNYKETNKDEQKVVAKPISIAFHKKIINAIYHGTSEAKLIAIRLIRVQSIVLAYTLSCNPLFKNAKFRIIITADDIEKHQEIYDTIKNNSRFEFIECNSDEEVVGEYLNMIIKPDLDIMNPPYDGSLHLEILSKVLANKKEGATVVSVQPARWIEDPLAEYKQGSDYKKYKTKIADKISGLDLIEANTACKAFNIMNSTDLGIYVFTDEVKNLEFNNQINLINKLNNKIATLSTLVEHTEKNSVSGFRCEVKAMCSGNGGHNLGNFDSSKIADVHIVWGPYNDGYDTNNKFFTETRQKNQFTKTYFAYSIPFISLEQTNNFNISCNTNFYYNLVQLFKWDQNSPLRFLPYMEDYSHAWTDEDYCKFFELTEEESKFMCRAVEDYRVKDFINYINLNED